ncbi:MCE family protein [Rhizobiales bacterium]|uniref:MCE family protein n=1 Tax=Hongsoonwoonella zoysiae TaxID=2821844 RepID=UPI00155FC48C|nr:MlaD family protein [Hongsoonwoonella zoysiae]NRG17983.1 MCE family protein [Hongsoonwoonella zoysiae]
METRANYIAIGAFVFAVIVAAFVFIYWLGISSNGTKNVNIKVIFPGAVTGLSTGGQVLYNGIKIGDVGSLEFNPRDPKVVVATLRVDPNAPLRKDTKATLGFQGLTGVAYVELSGGTPTSPSLFETADEEEPILYAERSAFEDIVEGARNILGKADTTLDTIEEVIAGNRDEIDQTIKNINQFSEALAKNSDGVDEFMASVADTGEALTKLSSRLEGLVGKAETIVDAVPADKVTEIVNDAAEITSKISESTDGLSKLIADSEQAAEQLQRFTAGLNESLKQFDAVLAEVEPGAVREILQGVSQFAEVLTSRSADIDKVVASTAATMENVEKVSKTLGDRQVQIAEFIDSAAAAGERLNSTLEGAGKIIATVNPQSVQDIVEGAASFSKVLSERRGDIDRVIASAASSMDNIEKVSKTLGDREEEIGRIVDSAAVVEEKLARSLDEANRIMSSVNSDEVARIIASLDTLTSDVAGKSQTISAAIDDAGKAAANIRSFTGDIEGRKPDIDQIITNVNELSRNLNAASVRIQGVIDRVDGMVSGDGEGFVSEATKAATAIRKAADILQENIGPIANGLNKFATRGSADFSAAMGQLNRTLVEIQRAVANIDRDPSRVIFGGSDTPTFGGARRR